MNASRTREDTFLTLAVALSLWGAAVVAVAGYGVFAKLSPGEFAALTVFATVFAVGTYFLDARLRRFVKASGRVAAIAVVLDATALAALAGLVALDTNWREMAAQLPYAPVILFVVPLAASLHAALLDGREPRRVTSPERKSPGATPAAT